MTDPKYAIFPGLLVGIVALFFFTRLGMSAEVVEAATEPAGNLTAPQVAAETQPLQKECELSDKVIGGVRQWCAEIESAAAKYEVEASLIAAVMTQESGGQEEVISPSGAVGLMQVMPSDGVAAGFMCVNGPCFAARPSTAELLDPVFNLDYGTRMLAGLIQKYGSTRDALSAYGPYHVGYYYADKVLAIQSGF